MSRFRLVGGMVLAAAMTIAGPATAQTVSNYAGAGLGDGAAATSATFVGIRTIAFDPNGNLLLVDNAQHRIRKINKDSGIISTFAGVGSLNTVGASGDGGPANQASINQPADMLFDGAGNAYIADSSNHRIRHVAAATGIITTFAGTGVAGSAGDGGPATSAQFNVPSALARDPAGNLYVAELSGHRIRRIDAVTGVISTIAGTGAAGFSGDGGPATAATFNTISGLALDASGNLYLTDRLNVRVRKINLASGTVTTIAGTGASGFSGDGGPATLAVLNGPTCIALDGAGNLYIGDRFNHRIRKVDAVTGIITSIAGVFPSGYSGDGGPATSAQLLQPLGMAFDAGGHLHFSDSFNARIRRIDAVTGVISTVAGIGTNDGRIALGTAMVNPAGMTKDASGNLVVADTFNARIRRIDRTTNLVTTLAGQGEQTTTGDGGPATAARINRPHSAKYDAAGNLYIVERSGHRIRRVDTAGNITTWAGTGVAGYTGDGGVASAATFTNPVDLVIDAAGHFLVTDEGNHAIRRIDKDTLVVTTLVGTGVAGYSGDGGPATAAQLNFPAQLALDGQGNLFIADGSNHRVRRVAAVTGTISTVAGNGIAAFAGDGGPAIAASMNNPIGVAVDSQGNVYVGDTLNGRVRAIGAASGTITTVFGTGPRLASGNFVSALVAAGEPQHLFLDGDATLYFADTRNNLFRRIVDVNTPFKAQQQIDFPTLPDRAYGSPGFLLAASAGSGLPVTFTSLTTTVCTVSGTAVTLLSAGTCTIAANQSGDATWAPAAQVTQSFVLIGLFRAYLSKNGADANPCTLAAPCRLLPAALAATKPGGEIWMLDSANFNAAAVTVSKSVTILAVPGALGSVVANNANALVIQGSATAEVTLRNLVILNLAGTSNNGVFFTQGAQLTVEGCEIYGMSSGIYVAAAGSLVNVKETTIRDVNQAAFNANASTIAVLDRVDLLNSAVGVQAQGGAQVHVVDSNASGNFTGISVTASLNGPVTKVGVSDSVVSNNTIGLDMASFFSSNAAEAAIADSVFTNNATGAVATGAGKVLFTRGNNAFRFNTIDVQGVVPTPLAAQ